MRFLLDTCTFIRLAMPQNKLSPLACELLDEADHARNDDFVARDTDFAAGSLADAVKEGFF